MVEIVTLNEEVKGSIPNIDINLFFLVKCQNNGIYVIMQDIGVYMSFHSHLVSSNKLNLNPVMIK